MKNLTDIKYRTKAVADTRQITKAMETISVAKMRKFMAKYERNKDYFGMLRETMDKIVLHTATSVNRYLKKSKGEKPAYIVIASDKGLAGGFNHEILTYAYKMIAQHPGSRVFTVGQMAAEFMKRNKIQADGQFGGAAYDPTMKDALSISETMKTLFDAHQIDEVFIVYTKLLSSVSMKPDIIKLLPLDAEYQLPDVSIADQYDEEVREFVFEPDLEAVFDGLIPLYVTGMVYGALIQSAASEHCSRRTAMNNANTNAAGILEQLGIEFNRARQEAITNEISEIVSTAASVNNRKNKGI